MKILYIDSGNRLGKSYTYQYYGDLYRELVKQADVTVYEGRVSNIEQAKNGKEYDCIIFGLGYFAQRDTSVYSIIPGLREEKSVVVCLLHKAQILLKEKLSFCKLNKIDLLVDSQITYKKFGELLDTSSTRIWFSADPEIYYDRGIERKYDVGFSGASPGSGKIQGDTADLRDRVFLRLQEHNLNLFWNRQTSPSHRISSVQEYATRMSESKIWVATTGPLLDVSPRYFEVVLSKTLLLCNDMPKQYEGVFVDGETCVTFKNDLSDFDEKLAYYLTNEKERLKIVENAYKIVHGKYTSNHMAQKLLEEVKTIKNGKHIL